MTWRENKDDFARVIDIDSPPKRLGNRIKLSMDENAIGFGRDTKVWLENDVLKIKDLKKVGDISRIIFFSNRHHSSTLEGAYKQAPDQEPIRVKVDYRFRISGDHGAHKLSKSDIFSEQSSISKSDLDAYLERDHKGKWKKILAGIGHDNKKDDQVNTRTTKLMEESLNNTGDIIGVEFVVTALRWKDSLREKSDSKRAHTEEIWYSHVVQTERKATVDLMRDSEYQKELKEDFQKNLREQQKHRLRLEEEDRRQEIRDKRHDRDEARREKSAKAAEERNQRIEARRIAEQQARAEREISKRQIRVPNKETSKLLNYEDIIFELHDENDNLEEFISSLRSRLRKGVFAAHQVDKYISELQEITGSREVDDYTLSSIFACLAELHRHRGNKQGDMDGYISKSLAMNAKNPHAILTKLDYLWERTPQQFHPSKAKKFEHQLREMETLILELESIDSSLFGPSNIEMNHKRDILYEALLNVE